MAWWSPDRLGPSAGTVLQFGPVVRGTLALLLAAAAAALVGVSMRYRGADARFLRITLAFFLVVLGGSGVEIFGVAHRLVPGGIERVTPWQKQLVVRWADVTSVSWSAPVQAYEVRTRNGEVVRVYQQLTGIASFARAALGGIPPSVLDADPGVRSRLEQLSRGEPPPDEPEPEPWRGG